MVGKRNMSFRSKNSDHRELPKQDLENGMRQKPRVSRFQDAANVAMDDKRRTELKKKLRDGIDRDEFEKYRKSDEELREIKDKKVRRFYETQNQHLNDWLEVDTIVISMSDDILDSMNPDRDHDGIPDRETALDRVGERIEQFLPEEERNKRYRAERAAKWAIIINIIANILLLAAKAIATTQSSSLSLIASLLDSALDLLCTLIVWTTTKLVEWRLNSLQRRFPVGRRRLEPLGILVFSIIMIISFAQILQESVSKLMPGGEKKATELPPAAIGALLGTVVLKGIIGLGCVRIKTTQVQALAQDCKTDVIFNTASLLFPFIGFHADTWWLDPAGAGLLALFIIYDWAETSFENVTRLSGSAVDQSLEKKLTYLAWRFSPVVNGFKSLTAYHAGDGVWAELDILLDEKTPLARSHDVAETMQYCCEALTEVDRAFVTTDYTSQGPVGHSSQ